MTLLRVKSDAFRGVTIDPKTIPTEMGQFSREIDGALREWRGAGVRGVWMSLPCRTHGHLLPEALRRGFVVHHAQAEYIMLTHWLQDEPNKLPMHGSCYVGVGGMVINDRDEILMVREKYLISDMWKFPGGLMNPGEDIVSAAKREVFEETGIPTEFVSVVGFRHMPKTPLYRFGSGDIYFVVKLRPLHTSITIENSEISEAKWMTVNEYLEHPRSPEMMRKFVQSALLNKGASPDIFTTQDKKYIQHLYLVSQFEPNHTQIPLPKAKL
ncbi:nudix hydrolase 10 [Pelomyxa schiedti]|nr:nudix hydrolase 10 [Pelomyxa schiedti]